MLSGMRALRFRTFGLCLMHIPLFLKSRKTRGEEGSPMPGDTNKP